MNSSYLTHWVATKAYVKEDSENYQRRIRNPKLSLHSDLRVLCQPSRESRWSSAITG